MSQQVLGEFLQQFPRVNGKGWQDVLTPPGWPLWRMTYHFIAWVRKMPLELARDRPLWRLLAASRTTHWNGASRTMMMMMMILCDATFIPALLYCFYFAGCLSHLWYFHALTLLVLCFHIMSSESLVTSSTLRWCSSEMSVWNAVVQIFKNWKEQCHVTILQNNCWEPWRTFASLDDNSWQLASSLVSSCLMPLCSSSHHTD